MYSFVIAIFGELAIRSFAGPNAYISSECGPAYKKLSSCQKFGWNLTNAVYSSQLPNELAIKDWTWMNMYAEYSPPLIFEQCYRGKHTGISVNISRFHNGNQINQCLNKCPAGTKRDSIFLSEDKCYCGSVEFSLIGFQRDCQMFYKVCKVFNMTKKLKCGIINSHCYCKYNIVKSYKQINSTDVSVLMWGPRTVNSDVLQLCVLIKTSKSKFIYKSLRDCDGHYPYLCYGDKGKNISPSSATTCELRTTKGVAELVTTTTINSIPDSMQTSQPDMTYMYVVESKIPLTTGAIVGTAVGMLLFLIVLAVFVFTYIRRRSTRQRTQQQDPEEQYESVEFDPNYEQITADIPNTSYPAVNAYSNVNSNSHIKPSLAQEDAYEELCFDDTEKEEYQKLNMNNTPKYMQR